MNVILKDAASAATPPANPGTTPMTCHRPARRLNGVAAVVLLSLFLSDAAPARTWHVRPDGSGDAPTIQAAVDSAADGDEILLSAGRYTWSNQGGGSSYGMVYVPRGVDNVTIRGEAGAGATVLDAQGRSRILFIQGFNNLVVEGLTFTGGVAPATGNFGGGGVITHLSGDIIRDCVFTGNSAQAGGGLWCGGVSTLRVENCTFRNNTASRGGAMYYINSNATQTIDGCVIRDNAAEVRGGGVYGTSSALSVSNTVFARNRAQGEAGGAVYLNDMWPSSISACTLVLNAAPSGAGIHLNACANIALDHTVVAYQSGAAFGSTFGSVASVSCSDVYANTANGVPAGWVDTGGNFQADPHFCGVIGSDNYFLENTSPCLPGNHPDAADCGLIGARGAGCAGVGVEEASWGRVKATYR